MRIALVAALAALSACAVNPGVSPMGGDRYHVSRQGATGASSIATLQAETLREADAFCVSTNRSLEVLNTKQTKPPYLFGNFPRAEVEFRCLK